MNGIILFSNPNHNLLKKEAQSPEVSLRALCFLVVEVKI